MEVGRVVDAPPDAKATPGDINQILKHMSENVRDVHAQIRSLRSMQMMLEFGRSQQQGIVRAKGAETIVAAMDAHAASAELHCHAALVLALLARGNREAQASLIASNVAETFTSSISAFLHVEELTASGAVALAALSQGFVEGSARVCAVGGHTAVLTAMDSLGDGLMQERGCELLAVLVSSGPDAATAVRQSGGLEKVVKVLGELTTSAEVQAAGCMALEEFVKAWSQGQLTASDFSTCIMAAVEAMRMHPEDVQVQDRACRALAVLLEGGAAPVRERCLEMGGAEAATAAIRITTTKGKGRPRAAFHVLACLASESDSASSSVVMSGGVRAIVEAMESCPKDHAMQESGFLALQRIAGSAGLDAVLDAGGTSVMRAVADAVPKLSAAVKRFLCSLEKRNLARLNVAEMD